jgi:hypothetical protein
MQATPPILAPEIALALIHPEWTDALRHAELRIWRSTQHPSAITQAEASRMFGFNLQPRALARKASDEFAVPLCRVHHRAVHRARDEQAWWQTAGIDPIKGSA